MMIFLLLLLFSGWNVSLMPTTTASPTNAHLSCFDEGTTWTSDDLSQTFPNINNEMNCQDLCKHNSHICDHFTYYTTNTEPLNHLCFLFQHPSTPIPCTQCVSGPSSCQCGAEFACEVEDHNLLDVSTSVASEDLCQEECVQFPSCSFYTYFDESSHPLKQTCYLFSSCKNVDFSCQGCFSGPGDCRNISHISSLPPTSSPTSTPPTITTSARTTTESNLECEIPEAQEHGDWFCPPSPKLSTCHLECHPGYVSNSRTVISCIEGEWNSSPRCVEAVALITGCSYSPRYSVEVYGNGLHKRLAFLPDDRSDHSLQLVDSSIILCGGLYTPTSCLSFTSSHGWVPHSTTKLPRWTHSSVSMLGQLHLLGGWDDESSLTTEYLAPPSTQWTLGWNVIEDMDTGCAAKVGPDVFILTGGYHSRSTISYNVTSGAAARLQNLIDPASEHGCCYVRGEEGSFGGVLVAGGYCRSCSQMYHIQDGQWASTGELTTERYGGRLIVLGENVFALGGKGPLKSVDKFNMTTRTWSAAERILEGRRYFAVAGVPPAAVGIGLH